MAGSSAGPSVPERAGILTPEDRADAARQTLQRGHAGLGRAGAAVDHQRQGAGPALDRPAQRVAEAEALGFDSLRR